MTFWNTVMIVGVAAGFAGLWLYDRYSSPQTTAALEQHEPRAVIRFDTRIGLYMPQVLNR